jgi:predicted O-methyltransferase YrrM
MSRHTIDLTDPLYDYLLESSLREPEVLARLRAETARMADPDMQIAPEQGQFMGLLVELIGARHAIEVGTFTGYSTAWMALSLADGGRIVACDVSEDYTRVARRYWVEAGVNGKIDLRL